MFTQRELWALDDVLPSWRWLLCAPKPMALRKHVEVSEVTSLKEENAAEQMNQEENYIQPAATNV